MPGSQEGRIRLEKKGGYARVALNRPAVRNALSFDLVGELVSTLQTLDRDDSVGAVVITGDDRAFSGGADVKEMVQNSLVSFTRQDSFAVWDRLGTVAKPLIAAVEGYALGGGCELAMACDIIVASERAKFGQPEINLGIIPGAGGTQRLTRAVGKQKAMRYVLTGEPFSSEDAERMGLVSIVVPAGRAESEACRIAASVASKPRMAVLLAKKAVRRAAEGDITDGILYERALFYSLFATRDQKEGMNAFLEKREADFAGE